ncbi:hypothetical protein C8Q74DRAFT_1008432 [Fomes fomentarius]|nr:hypothetical protein C8Q74DRAFT_1008432 [Fomes fomentarius]
MDNSRLPVEMCEHIIDSVTHDAWYDSTECDIWCLTALVCAVWLPRSRFNLYHTVRLWRAGQVDLLCRTLEENSLFAHLIVALKVDLDSAEYIPFTRLAPLLKECVILRLDGMGGWKFYPTRFADTCLNQFSLLGIVKLRLTVAKSTARGLLRFIRSLTTLEQLTLDGEESLPEMRPIPALGARRSQNGKLAGLSKLKKLKLKVRNLPRRCDYDTDDIRRTAVYPSNFRRITLETLWGTYPYK